MRIRLIILIILLFPSLVWASPNAVNRDADRQTLFNNVTDSFSARGKTETEKKEIIRKRRQERRQKRLDEIKQKKKEETLKRLHPKKR